MRRKRPWASKILFLISIALAVGATLFLQGHLARLEARAAAAGPGSPAVVAAADLDRGTVLDPSLLRLQTIPDRNHPPGAVGAVGDVAGRTLASPLLRGEAVTSSRLAPPGGPLAAAVPPGLRAVSVSVAVPPGPLVRGDRVDVLATYAGGEPHTETVVAEAEVLISREGASSDALGSAVVVVLLVGPEDAERLAFARSFAELSLAVRSAEDGP
ncbi:MAG: Flp pilus assembly protein CpaB [Actinomycetota bacterium]|nr:Flp pilus assembly protein CpaB [Actinomycetota bacterium]